MCAAVQLNIFKSAIGGFLFPSTTDARQRIKGTRRRGQHRNNMKYDKYLFYEEYLTPFMFSIMILLFYVAECSSAGGIPGVELSMPSFHVALSGDLHIQFTSKSFTPLLLQLSRSEDNLVAQSIMTTSVFPKNNAIADNSTKVSIPCGYFSKAGQYHVIIKKSIGTSNETTLVDQDDPTITRSLVVRWPMPQLSLTPEYIQTYPVQSVVATLEFPEVVCPPMDENPASAIPEFWLELHYCGLSTPTYDFNNGCNQNKSESQMLYSEQVRGFPDRHSLALRCEFFGLAGHYALYLRPTTPSSTLPHTAAYVKADWSEQFVFNVHAHSIFPCDVHSGGIAVLFQYPTCILAATDRVRLFARSRANVASLAPPTKMKYIAEQRVLRGHHKIHFDCDLFTEHYVEYCFVYVSQAITGAVADVRMDCVPTLPVSDQENGGWGPWSAWTQCSSTCIGGTRSRYRFCDSPPPRYGTKFCKGRAVQTEKCGNNLSNDWECFYTNKVSIGDFATKIPDVQAEVGPYCRCGCVVHLSHAKPKRLLAASSQSCPGRTFWLIEADYDFIIQLRIEQFYFPCEMQWLKVRDGNSLASNLLVDLSGTFDISAVINSTGTNLLLEFFSAEPASSQEICNGGFMAHANQIRDDKNNISYVPVAQSEGVFPAIALELSAVHIAAIFFLSGLLISTTLLSVQYLLRYRKYHVAEAEDQDSLAKRSGSKFSLSTATRTSSNATLLSEIISLKKLHPYMKPRDKRVRLQDSIGSDLRQENVVSLAKREESLSIANTLTQAESLKSIQQQATKAEETNLTRLKISSQSFELGKVCSSTSISDKYGSNKKKLSTEDNGERRLSDGSNTTLINGCYSSMAGLINTASIRTTNVKETKDQRNREKLLTGPTGSDFSIIAQDMDLEMDYYDYNVTNAGAAPGSYLGMDPAFLVWIPPLDDFGEILPDENQEYHKVEDIMPKIYLDTGSNKESPEEEVVVSKCRDSPIADQIQGVPAKFSPALKISDNKIVPLPVNVSTEKFDNKYISGVQPVLHKSIAMQMYEFPTKQVYLSKLSRTDVEKETEVKKSPSFDNILNTMKFADEEDEDLEETQCNINIPYQRSNILSLN